MSCLTLCWNILHILISIAIKHSSCHHLYDKILFRAENVIYHASVLFSLRDHCLSAVPPCWGRVSVQAARCVRVTSFWRGILDRGKLWTKLTSEGGRQSKTSFLLILNIDFKMLYCSLWRPGCSASAGNMICYNEWNKLKQECLPSLFKLNLYLAQSVSGGLIQGVTI